MSQNFIFSIVIAIYNTEKYLSDAIESILNQTFGFDEVQIVLVDDGSTDNCGKICKEYQKKYPNNIKYIYKKNGGQTTARNLGMEFVEGKYINFMDSDDKFELNALQEVYNFFEKYGDEIDVVSTPRYYFGAEERPLSLNYRFSETRVIDINKEYNSPQLAINSVFIRKSNLTEKFDTRLNISEDATLVNKIILKKCKYGVVNTTKYLYRRREEENSTIDTGKLSKDYFIPRLQHYMKELINESLKNHGHVLKYIQFALMFDLQWMYEENTIRNVLDEEEFLEFETLLYEILQYVDDEIILEQKYFDKYMKRQILEFKHYSSILKYVHEDNDLILKYDDYIIDKLSFNRINIFEYNTHNSILHLKGVFDSCFNDYKILVYYNDAQIQVMRINGEERFALGNQITNRFYFEINMPLVFKENKLSFYVEIDSQKYSIHLKNDKKFNFNLDKNILTPKESSKAASNVVKYIKGCKLENKNEIFTLWISEDEYLPELPLLSLKSMVLMNHDVVLYTYNHIKNVPAGVIVKDANEIYDKSMIFKYKKGRHKSYSGFANMFRLKRLYEQGGTWVDLDIILIKNLNDVYDDDIIICSEPHKDSYIHCNNAILRFPKKDPFIKHMFDFAEERGKDVNHGETGPHLITKEIFKRDFTSYAQFLKTPAYNNLCGWWEIDQYFIDPRILLNNVDLSSVVGFHLVNTFFKILDITDKNIGMFSALKNAVLNSNTCIEYIYNLKKNNILNNENMNYYSDMINFNNFNSENVKITFLIDAESLNKHDLYLIMGSIEKSDLNSYEILVFGPTDLNRERITYRKSVIFLNSSFTDIKEDIKDYIHGNYVIPINHTVLFKNNWFEKIFDKRFDILKVNFDTNKSADSLTIIYNSTFDKLIKNNEFNIFYPNLYNLKSSFNIVESINENIFGFENNKTFKEQKVIKLIDQLLEFNANENDFKNVKKELNKINNDFKPNALSYKYIIAYESILKSNTNKEFKLNNENALLKTQLNWANKSLNDKINNLEKETINFENETNELKNKIKTKKEHNKNLRNQISTLEGKQDNYNNKIQRLNIKLTENKNQIKIYEENINKMFNSKYSKIIRLLVEDDILKNLNVEE